MNLSKAINEQWVGVQIQFILVKKPEPSQGFASCCRIASFFLQVQPQVLVSTPTALRQSIWSPLPRVPTDLPSHPGDPTGLFDAR